MTTPRATDGRGGRRTVRTTILVVGADVRMRALSAQLRRIGAGVREATLVTDALAIVGAATAREPIGGVVVCVRTPDFDASAVVAAFERVDPLLPIHATLSTDELGLDAELVANGFEESIELPARDTALLGLLEDCGALVAAAREADPAAPTVSAGPPQPRDVVELEVGKARERATRAASEAAETHGTAPHASAPRTPPSQGPKPTPTASTERAARPVERPAPHPQTALEHLGDADLADALAVGEPIEPLALEIIRTQLRAQDIRFASAIRPAERESIARERARRGRQSAEVRPAHGEGVAAAFGELVSESVPAARLAPWAAWLASWLRLEERVVELRQLAMTDELTGAGNRRAFHEAFAAATARARASRRTVSLMYFDLDDFKRYNDEHGHETGDEVLRETVELLRQSIRKGDRIFRFGGDEFVVLFANGARAPGEGGDAPESIEALADRFRRALKDLALPQLGAQGAGTITVSGGVSVFPWDASGADDLIRLAEERARRSKAEGKNVITFGPSSDGAEDAGPDGERADPGAGGLPG